MRFPFFSFVSDARGVARAGFTVIELLIVVAILGILSAAVVAVLSPAELLKQARDSTRVADLDTLNTALKLAEFNGVSMGSSSVVYLSVPDTTSTCASYTLPTLPSGWAYRCVTSANLNKTDGTGWIPVNFSAITETTFSSLPVDPSQNATSSLFYAYATGNRYALSAAFESAKYGDVSANDGGYDPSLYEAGANPTLAPFMHGLVGYWPMDESSGLTFSDLSGYARDATVSSTVALATTTGCHLASTCQYFMTTTSASTAISSPPEGKPYETKIAWIKMDSAMANNGKIFDELVSNSWDRFQVQNTTNLNAFYVGPNQTFTTPTGSITKNQWYMVAAVFDGVVGEVRLYVNGALKTTGTFTPPQNISILTNNLAMGGCPVPPSQCYLGWISGVRLYARALSTAEILNIYNARQ